jgi:hypothetical protein
MARQPAYAPQFHFNIPSTAPVGAHQTFGSRRAFQLICGQLRFSSMYRKTLFLPALFLGMLIGLFACEYLLHPETSALRSDREVAQFLGVILGIYGVLTRLLFGVRRTTFGLSPMQLRLGWISAFILGAVGTPLIYELGRWDH